MIIIPGISHESIHVRSILSLSIYASGTSSLKIAFNELFDTNSFIIFIYLVEISLLKFILKLLLFQRLFSAINGWKHFAN